MVSSQVSPQVPPPLVPNSITAAQAETLAIAPIQAAATTILTDIYTQVAAAAPAGVGSHQLVYNSLSLSGYLSTELILPQSILNAFNLRSDVLTDAQLQSIITSYLQASNAVSNCVVSSLLANNFTVLVQFTVMNLPLPLNSGMFSFVIQW